MQNCLHGFGKHTDWHNHWLLQKVAPCWLNKVTREMTHPKEIQWRISSPWWYLMNTGAKIFQMVLVSSMTGLLIHIFKNLTPGLVKPLTYPRIREITHSTQSQDSISNWYPYSMKPGVTIFYILLRFLAATAMCNWCKRHHGLWDTLLQEINIECQDDIKSNMWNTFEILSDIMIILSWYKMHGPLSCSR